jgi:putative membrane protein
MPPLHHTATAMSLSSSTGVLVLVLVFFLYVRGWRRIQRASASAIPGWRAASFILGISLVWVALGSPLAAYDHDLLTVHMIQHLLLMTLAPPLILLGEPMLAFWLGLPQTAQTVLHPVLRRPLVQRFARMLSLRTLCWTVAALTLLGWHMPALFALGMQSAGWHVVEQASFSGAGFLFWWPVVQPWPDVLTGPQWSTLLYLFLATLPCDILSGFLVFSDRVAYPVYFSMPRHFGLSVMEDQQCAAALMWTCVTLVYLVPAAIVSTRLLSPRAFYGGALPQSELRGSTAANSAPQSLETV